MPLTSTSLIVVAAVAAIALVGAPTRATAQPGQKAILVLASSRRDVRITALGAQTLPAVIEERLEQSVDAYFESIDQARFPDPGYQTAFREFLRAKYQGRHFDVVIPLQDVATAFVSHYRDDLFPSTPVVFYATDGAPRLENATGVLAQPDLTTTLTLALALQPDLEQVFVVAGASGRDKANEDGARAQFRSLEPRLKFTYLSALPIDQLLRRLAALPPRSIVYYLLFYQDSVGENVNPVTFLDRVTEASNRPVYSWVDTTIGHGVVGGGLRVLDSLIDTLANQAVRVLRGTSANGIPIVSSDVSIKQVDWRQLRRWKINERRVPEGTLVLFRDPSVWERYKVYIVAAAALLAAQSILIGGLLAQVTRRRRAEDEVRRRETELRSSYERIRDLGGRLLNAQEGERARIARELHDDISQHLAILAIDLQRVSRLIVERPQEAERLAAEASDRTQSVGASVRDLSHRLHPSNLAFAGLVPALSGLQRTASTDGVEVSFSHGHVPSLLSNDLTLCLFRIAEEAVQNAIRHSRGTRIDVNLDSVGDAIMLTVVDNGGGFNPLVAERGLGLISMRERIELAGGTLHVLSAPGEGTRITARVGLPGEQKSYAAG